MTYIDSDEDDDDIMPDSLFKLKKQGKRCQERRIAICGEIHGRFRRKVDIEPVVIKKKNLTRNRILFRLKAAFIFNDLDESEINLLINAME